MPTLSIREALIGADFHPLRPTKRSRAPISPPPPLSPASPTQRLFCGSYSRRYFRQISRCKLKSDTLFSRSRQPSATSPDIDLKCVDYGSEAALELMNYGHSSEDKPPEDSGFQSGIKMTILTALLISLDSQQAVASTEFGGAQLISYMGDLGDISTGFASAFLLIFFSELGDKTFFIAALLAARNSGAVVFAGTFGALAAMTVVSVVLGRAFHFVDGIIPFRFGDIDFPIDDFAAVCLLVYFGVTTLLDAASGDDQKIKEEQEEAELAISELSGNGAGIMAVASTVISTFLLVFVAEWGDKSFFSTIALAAASSPLGVIGGALAGHALATLVAVLGGSLLGTFLSEKVIAYVGGSLFLLFAAVTLIEIVT
ncbi:GDT1-like protein 1, chloroplastic [Ananas comosus]|uniref:GDT1 family protein n=1 Tax=Ananas comosus TaxID=4615 RepID=A0A6P5FWM2_ANACO|nr:GDT1-like protein 1, chloroplastic [Ananas comosus]